MDFSQENLVQLRGLNWVHYQKFRATWFQICPKYRIPLTTFTPGLNLPLTLFLKWHRNSSLSLLVLQLLNEVILMVLQQNTSSVLWLCGILWWHVLTHYVFLPVYGCQVKVRREDASSALRECFKSSFCIRGTYRVFHMNWRMKLW